MQAWRESILQAFMRVEDAVYLGLGTLLAAIALVLLVAVAVAFERALLGDMNPLFTCQRRAAAESEERVLLSDHAGFLRLHPQSVRFRLRSRQGAHHVDSIASGVVTLTPVSRKREGGDWREMSDDVRQCRVRSSV